ncbi:MAG: threonylcarbamoyl-AMP synthase [Lachnospiraceae bacterium]|nr:threonylcarbamoyl-AMP synthase [Lachnospiraceae bacterium]
MSYMTAIAEPTEENIARAGRIIRDGGLVAFPTETVYGLGGDALNPESSAKIYAAKGRPSDNPLIVHICELSALYEIAEEVPEEALVLADRFWPGPLTMIFKKKSLVPRETTGGLETVAVRMPDNRTALELIRAAGGFIAAPSANLSGKPSPTTAKRVFEDMDGRIELILDGGRSVIGLESTIVDLTGEEVPMILRPGYVSDQMIREAVGAVFYDPAVFGTESGRLAAHNGDAGKGGTSDAQAGLVPATLRVDNGEPATNLRPKAPGMRYRHYAPQGELSIVCGGAEEVCAAISELCRENSERGKKCGVIAFEESVPLYLRQLFPREEKESNWADTNCPREFFGNGFKGCKNEKFCVINIGSKEEEGQIAGALYESLRFCDDEGIEEIFAEELWSGEKNLSQAISNRLLKAAGGKLIDVKGGEKR